MKITKQHDVFLDEYGQGYEFVLGHVDVAGFNAAREAESPSFHESNDPIESDEELDHLWATTTGEVYGEDLLVEFHDHKVPGAQPVTVVLP